MELPKDIQNLTLRYVHYPYFQFLQWFVNNFYIEAEFIARNNKRFEELLKLNKLNSQVMYFKIGPPILKWDETDTIDLNILKQFILFILPIYFKERLDRDAYDSNNGDINHINRELRKHKIPLAIVGAFSQISEGKPDQGFYLYDGKDNIEIEIGY